MSFLYLLVPYTLVAFLFFRLREAFAMVFMASLICVALSYFIKRAGIVKPHLWFKEFKLRAGLVLISSALMAGMVIYNSRESLLKDAIEVILAFLWFWLFAVVATYVESRARNKLDNNK
jgi:hypothetical protein